MLSSSLRYVYESPSALMYSYSLSKGKPMESRINDLRRFNLKNQAKRR